MFKDMLQSISNNYNHMMDHMRNMFHSFGGYKNGIGNEKFYYEYEERRIGIDKKIQSEAETSDIGGNTIISFGQKTKETIKDIIKKQVNKRKIFAWIPLIVLLCVFILGSIVTQDQNRNTIEVTETTTNNDDSSVKEVAKGIGMKVIEESSLGTIGTVLSACAMLLLTLVISLGAVLIFILLFIIFIYMLYLKIIKVWCNHRICKECGEYLTTEFLQFEQSNELSVKLEVAMQNAADEYEKEYMNVLHNLFESTQFDSDHTTVPDEISINSLREKWNEIKYE